MKTQNPSEFFTQLAPAFGLPNMQLDAEHTCSLSMGDSAVLTLALRPAANNDDAESVADPMLVAFAYLGPLPVNQREATLARLLEANFVWAETGGSATLALQPGADSVNLMQQWRITPDLHATGVAVWIADFAAMANHWIEALAKADAALGDSLGNSVQDFQQAGGGMAGMGMA